MSFHRYLICFGDQMPPFTSPDVSERRRPSGLKELQEQLPVK